MKSLVTKQEWWRSRVFIKAIFAAGAIILKKFVNVNFSDEEINTMVEGVLNIIEIGLWLYVAYGIRNNPTLKEEL